MIYNTDLG